MNNDLKAKNLEIEEVKSENLSLKVLKTEKAKDFENLQLKLECKTKELETSLKLVSLITIENENLKRETLSLTNINHILSDEKISLSLKVEGLQNEILELKKQIKHIYSIPIKSSKVLFTHNFRRQKLRLKLTMILALTILNSINLVKYINKMIAKLI